MPNVPQTKLPEATTLRHNTTPYHQALRHCLDVQLHVPPHQLHVNNFQRQRNTSINNYHTVTANE
eukprot:4316752-Amphidinium_carterae.1